MPRTFPSWSACWLSWGARRAEFARPGVSAHLLAHPPAQRAGQGADTVFFWSLLSLLSLSSLFCFFCHAATIPRRDRPRSPGQPPVIDRLFVLNAQRAEEEAKEPPKKPGGGAPKKGGRGRQPKGATGNDPR